MNFLIIGSGAREHALAVALHRSAQHPRLFCCGTSLNPGIAKLTDGYWIGDITAVELVSQQAQQWHIDIAIIGPEAPLEKGMADQLNQLIIPTIGPKKVLAQLETSKQFARDLMQKYHIAGLPNYRKFHRLDGVLSYLNELGEGNYVVKANGLMGGKGVKVAGEHLHSSQDALAFCAAILAKQQPFIIEEKLIGQEFSLMCFVDGNHLIPMPLVQDHKRAFCNDKGPNTGGMGSYSAPDHGLPFLTTPEVEQAIKINQAVFNALSQETGEQYKGILYGSFIATGKGIYVIEFNARFGDPEALNVLSLLESDFVNLCQALVKGNLSAEQVRFAHKATVCKYVVPEGYPDAPLSNFPVDFSQISDPNYLYLAAVNQVNDQIIATGSRTAAYVGIADNITAAEQKAEQEVARITGRLFHRQDIGTARLLEARIAHMHRLRAS